jgi:hypothetical protein
LPARQKGIPETTFMYTFAVPPGCVGDADRPWLVPPLTAVAESGTGSGPVACPVIAVITVITVAAAAITDTDLSNAAARHGRRREATAGSGRTSRGRVPDARRMPVASNAPHSAPITTRHATSAGWSRSRRPRNRSRLTSKLLNGIT